MPEAMMQIIPFTFHGEAKTSIDQDTAGRGNVAAGAAASNEDEEIRHVRSREKLRSMDRDAAALLSLASRSWARS